MNNDNNYLNKVLDFFGLNGEDEINEKKDNNENSSKIISLNRNKKRKEKLKLIFYYPDSYDEVKKIVDDLNARKPVILNLDKLENKEARRFIDFISGAVYSLKGTMKKVGNGVFLFTPQNIKIDGQQLNNAIKNKFFAN